MLGNLQYSYLVALIQLKKNIFVSNYSVEYNPSTSANWMFLVTGYYNPNSHSILISLESNSWKDYNISFYIPANSIIGFKK